ncbi:MAG: CinA family protein [Coriobacteriia bacterium]|nr:CinA family protein [Coriobacteriia bacterium]
MEQVGETSSCFSDELHDLCVQLSQRFIESNRTLSTAESLTGGLLGACITSVPGASRYYAGGFVTYQTLQKQRLIGVSCETLGTFGPASAQCAEEMAIGARLQTGSDVAISVTGVAGPESDEFGVEVGTVYFGLSDRNKTMTHEESFAHFSRDEIRALTIKSALRLISDFLS